MRCDECKYSKVKTQVMPDKEIVSERYCHFNVPRTEMLNTGRGLAQITFRPKVEDDDFCSEFSVKRITNKDKDDIFHQPERQTASTKPSLVIDSSGRSSNFPNGV